MKTKELTINVLTMSHNESKLIDRELAQMIVEANFEILPDFQEFIRLAGGAYVLEKDAFNIVVQRLRNSLEGMYSCIKRAGDGVTLADYNLAANQKSGLDNEEKKRQNLLKRAYDSLGSYETFKSWYELYTNELHRQSRDDIRVQAQLDSIVIIKNDTQLKLGDYIKIGELSTSGKSLELIYNVLQAEPFAMNHIDALFVFNYINQQNFIANTSLPLLGYGQAVGEMFVQGKWGLQEDREAPRPIELVIDSTSRLASIETKTTQFITQEKHKYCQIVLKEQMTLQAGIVTGRKSTISSDKPFTVPEELVEYSECIKELGMLEQLGQYLAGITNSALVKFRGHQGATLAPKMEEPIAESDAGADISPEIKIEEEKKSESYDKVKKEPLDHSEFSRREERLVKPIKR